ncbi:hypothetical protein C8A01DRAFT_34513 [Parachaetomium inaequale]|uniref:RING-type domain-containing protein n=1 Tax=Parachaetomium inaequale TaxID=2588326 RepID=A0AAN6PK42_9PEZI|nr:hypothetical protein C8A01DRAFT_34513 [Parachaetomium inaequale]
MALSSNLASSLIPFAFFLLTLLVLAWAFRSRPEVVQVVDEIFVGDYHPQWCFSVSQRARYRVLVRSLPVLQYDPGMALPPQPRWPGWKFALPVGVSPPPASNPAHRDANPESSQCVICTEDFVVGDNIRRLPCCHFFHLPCIDPWLLEWSPTCPLW